MPYVNIPDSALAGATSKIVGKLQGELVSKIMEKIFDIVSKLNVDGCPSDDLTRIRKKIDRILSQVSSMDAKMAKFRAIPRALKPPISGLKAALKLILLLPIPQAVPPGIGLPINITTKYADILHLIKELIKQTETTIATITLVVKMPSLNLKTLQGILDKADSALRACEIERALRNQLEAGTLTEEELENIGLYDQRGRLIFSTLGPKLLADVDRYGTSDGRRSANRGKWNVGQLYYENDKVSHKKIRYICVVEHTSTLNNQPPSSFWIRLSASRLTGEGDTSESTRTAESSAKSNLLGDLAKLDNSNISKSAKEDIRKLLDTFKTVPVAEQKKDSNFFHTGLNGELLTISIITDPSSPSIAPRRYAEAKNANGGIVMTGPKSFSSDAKVLIDEIKFRIDNQLS